MRSARRERARSRILRTFAAPMPVCAAISVAFVAIAMIGIVTSGVWTIGYLTQVES